MLAPARREKMSINTGSTMRISTGASRMPPTTTRASGFCTWEPMPVDIAAGNKPTQATVQVMITGRIWISQARKIAPARSNPASIRPL